MTTALAWLRRAEAQPAALQVIHHVSASAGANAPLDAIDLSEWAFHLTSDEYVRCAPEHHGSVQAVLPGPRRVFVSVETIVGSLMSHSYIEDLSSRDHMRAISSNSQIWWAPGQLATMKVTWDLRLRPASGQGCQLHCDILVETADTALIAAVARSQPAASAALQAHCVTETQNFAGDMATKARSGFYAK
jgi:hypothetical protein